MGNCCNSMDMPEIDPHAQGSIENYFTSDKQLTVDTGPTGSRRKMDKHTSTSDTSFHVIEAPSQFRQAVARSDL